MLPLGSYADYCAREGAIDLEVETGDGFGCFSSEFRDAVFEDVVFDNNRCYL